MSCEKELEKVFSNLALMCSNEAYAIESQHTCEYHQKDCESVEAYWKDYANAEDDFNDALEDLKNCFKG